MWKDVRTYKNLQDLALTALQNNLLRFVKAKTNDYERNGLNFTRHQGMCILLCQSKY